MNDQKRTLTLAWLMRQAKFGKLPKHLDDECREYAVSFITAAVAEVQNHRDPVVLAVITHSQVEGEYTGG